MKTSTRRLVYFLLSLATIAIGLSTRKLPHLFPHFIAKYGGDTLWAMLFILLARIIWPFTSIWKIAAFTSLFCIGIECSQLYQAEWINNLRKTFPGQMLLGSGFLWSDLVCYAVGILAACMICRWIDSYSTTPRS